MIFAQGNERQGGEAANFDTYTSQQSESILHEPDKKELAQGKAARFPENAPHLASVCE